MQEVTFLELLKNKETQEKAFIELIGRYKERLYWHIRKIVIVHDDADDVLQNTFVKVFKNIVSVFFRHRRHYRPFYGICHQSSIFIMQKH